ncbi:MAG: hypothetical protein AB7F43_01945 [Bacteriovoracia bacterium]
MQLTPLKETLKNLEKTMEQAQKQSVYRFAIFKGKQDETGKITKVKNVGSAYIRDGLRTYFVHLKTFLKDEFFLLPNSKKVGDAADFVILTREPAAQNLGRKYFWNNVGEARVLDGVNQGLMKLSWDVLATDLYMQLYPDEITGQKEALRAEEAA